MEKDAWESAEDIYIYNIKKHLIYSQLYTQNIFMVKVLYPTIRLRFIFFVRSPRLTSNLDQFLTEKNSETRAKSLADKLVGNQEMLGKRIIFTIPDFFFRLFVGVVIFIQFVESRYRHRPGFFLVRIVGVANHQPGQHQPAGIHDGLCSCHLHST